MYFITQFFIKKLFRSLLLSVFIVTISKAQTKSVFPENSWGVYSWIKSTGLTKENAPHLKGGPILLSWSYLETADGKFLFDEQIGSKLKTLESQNMYCFLKIWVAPAGEMDGNGNVTKWLSTPKWIFEKNSLGAGVPLVECSEQVNPLGVPLVKCFPHYLNKNYIDLYHRMISKLGEYLLGLPDNLRSRILYIQSAEGSTGDGGPYKGNPKNPVYNISKDTQWGDFRLAAWKQYKAALTNKDGVLQVPLMTNDDSNSPLLRKWMLDELPNAIGVKNGMFSHGYQISDAQERVKSHFELREAVVKSGKEFFARGEQDAEYKTHGWSTQNIPQGFYWSAIYATHCGLSMWNVPTDALPDTKNFEAYKFFNKYAAQFYPRSSKGAFCAFYRGLDASDGNLFPAVPFGKVEKRTKERYEAICNSFKEFGAKMDDPEAATGGGMVNRSASGYNDAGWKILTTNFERHLTQIDPETTSQAWWNVDSSIYGRFARGFKNGANAMYFNLDDAFFGSSPLNGGQDIQISITYRDSDAGSWKLQYDATNGNMKDAIVVTNSGTGTNQWKTETVTIKDAYLGNRGTKGSDFALVNTGGTACRFHMIEVEKTRSLSAGINIINEADEINILQDYNKNTVKVTSKNNIVSIKLYDLSGKELQRYKCNDQFYAFDNKKLSPGIYIIVVKDQFDNYRTDKLVVK